MIARTWRGWASLETADEYQRHYEAKVAVHLQEVPGFLGARLLRRSVEAGEDHETDGGSVLFTSVAYFTSLEAVRGFAGDDCEQAVVEEGARRVLIRWDERVSHHDVVLDLSGGPAE